MGDTIAMTVRRKTTGAPRVRFARSDAVPEGVLSVVLSGTEVVVTYGAGAVVDAGGPMAPSGGGLAMSGLLLTAGDLELAVTGDSGPPAADPDRDFEAMWRRASAAAAEEGATEVSSALVVREAEWEPARYDGPTRLQPLVEIGAEARAPHVEPTNPSARANVSARERRRVVVRRVALLSMLLCAFTLAMHARRLRARRAVALEAPHVAAVVAKPTEPPPERALAVDPASATTPGEAPPERITRVEPARAATGAASRPRAAADALANGAYADALQLYRELAAESEANPAYAKVIEILRGRVDPKGARSR